MVNERKSEVKCRQKWLESCWIPPCLPGKPAATLAWPLKAPDWPELTWQVRLQGLSLVDSQYEGPWGAWPKSIGVYRSVKFETRACKIISWKFCAKEQMTFKHGLNFNSADNRKDEEVLSWELVSQRWGQNELDWTFQHCILFCLYSLPKPVALLATGKFGTKL